jgi:C1A family cysteine protease
MIEGTVSQDEGAAIRDGIKAIATYGVCEESLWPFDEHKVLLKPSMEAYQEATRRKALSYQRVDQTHEALMHVLGVAKRPVVLGIQIYESFESVTVEKTGIVPMPSHHERCLGGHAVLAVGYDAQRHVYFGRNSWSDQWGIHGYFEIPFDYLIRQDLASDFWVVSRIS